MRRCSEPEDLFETISQTLLNAVDRDAYSGWGAMVTIMCVFSAKYPGSTADRPLQDTR
jgi:20S proteasome alpha/beta subunit